MIRLSTLCYIEKDGKYLMLHRTVKKNDVNKDKWIGVGGHFEDSESPEECLLREVWEETGYTLTSWKYRELSPLYMGILLQNTCHFIPPTDLRESRTPAMKENWSGWRRKRSLI